MPELPEGTINAFIQNKNLAKYGLLKDNDGGFLAATCVEIKYRAPHAIDATCFRSYVCSTAWRFHAIDAMLSP